MSFDVEVNLDGLEELKQLLQGGYVKVGILGNAAREDSEGGITNTGLGIIHEFGAPEANIPARSFLRVPLTKEKKKLARALTSQSAKNALENGDKETVLDILAVAAEGVVLKAFDTNGYGTWQGNKAATVSKKGSNAPLIDTGQLRGSIASEVVE